MSLKEFEKQYLSLLQSNDENKVQKIVNLVSDNIDNDELSADYLKRITDEIVQLREKEMTAEQVLDSHRATPVVELNDFFKDNSDEEIELSSETLDKQNHVKIFSKKNLRKAALAGFALASAAGLVHYAGMQPQQDVAPQVEQVNDKVDNKTYEKLPVKEGTNFNPNDLNQLTQAGADFAKELSAGGFSSFYNAETNEYTPITAEDALMLTEALNLGSNEYDEWRKAQIKHDESSAQRYDEVMNELYTFAVADSMSLANNENSKIDWSKAISNQELSTMVNGLQDDIIAYNTAKPESKKAEAKKLLDKWVTAMENRSDLPTNDAVMSVLQAQMYGFVNRMQFDGYSFEAVGFDESRFANVFYDLPSCQEIDQDAYNAYWHGNTRTENSDVTVTRMDRKVEFESFFDEVKENKKEIKDGTEDKKYKEDAEWEDLVDLTKQKMGDLEVIPNPDFTQAKIDAMLAEQGGIDLQPGESIQFDANGNAYVLAGGTVQGDGANLPSEEEVDKIIEDEKNEMQEDAAKYYDTGLADAMANGDRTGSLMNVPGKASEAEKNGYKTGYMRGVEYNKLAYQLGAEGQALTGELAGCQNAYNEGYKVYEQNKKDEEQENQQDQENQQKLAEEAYNAGYAAFGAGASRDSVPEQYKDYSIEWQNGWDNAKLDKEHNVGNIEDGPTEGENVETPGVPETPEQPTTPEVPKTPAQPEAPAYSWNDVYNAGIQTAYAAGANENGAACPACPAEYAGFEDAWAAGWGTALLEYEMNKGYNAQQAVEPEVEQAKTM